MDAAQGVPLAIDPVVAFTLRASLALLFALASFHKASRPRDFTSTLAGYRIVPERAAAVLTPLIFLLEAGIAAGLLVPGAAAPAAVASGILLCVYSVAIATNLARGRRHIDCGCLGPRARQPLSGWLLARNAALIGAAALAALPPGARTLVWVDAVSVLGAVLVLGLLFAATNALLATSALASSRRPVRRSA
jgi:uncharacterized membrane protein YphA (DoxX/SURF4 family)